MRGNVPKNKWEILADELGESQSTSLDSNIETPSDEAIRAQLNRVLASPRFHASPRCQSLLNYVVEEYLAGNSDALKERTIGVAVFKRPPAYDTSSDPVVRVAAGETRKKLAQYYCEPEQAEELRIALPVGSYHPEFHLPTPEHWPDADVPQEPVSLSASAELQQADVAPATMQTEMAAASRRAWRPKFLIALAILAALAMGGFSFLFHHASHQALNDFWYPITRQSSAVLIVVGQLRATNAIVDTEQSHQPNFEILASTGSSQVVRVVPVTSLEDATTTANLAVLLNSQKKSAIINGATSTTFDDLKRTPAILVGGLNNDWTIRLTRPLRFSFSQDATGTAWWIVDQKAPQKHIGEVQLKTSDPMKVEQDFAIVLRLINSETGQPVIAVAGITAGGTRAAAEFITNEEYLQQLTRSAPADWKNKNVELLISSKIIGGQPGRPQLVANSTW